MQEPIANATEILSFGPYKLNIAERLLERDGNAVILGGRALDLLIAFVENAGAVISKDDLMARVWHDITIEEGGLRVHIANLRKALGDGKDGARYIINVAGRGYCFVAPIIAPSSTATPATPQRAAIGPERRLPPKPTGIIGREETVESLSREILAHRFVTLTGPGGIGKTTTAVSIAHALSEEFLGVVYFVDLTSVSDPTLVPGTLVSALGGTIQSGDPLTGLLAFLRDKHCLLLLDNCEHVIDAAASTAERLFQEASDVFILTTSREPLRVKGEHVHHLIPLACPSSGAVLSLADAMIFPAVQLFVERASAADNRFELTDTDASAVATICRMLDGIALAIELAASQVNVYGIQGLAELIDDRLALLTQGSRTAPPRHQTLQALLDWSYDPLPPLEKEVLRRLSRFSARFTLNAAKALTTEADGDLAPIVAALSSLVSKSLVAREAVGKGIRYRLLDTTREYASAKLRADDDPDLIARRHALYLSELLKAENARSDDDEERWLVFSEYLGDVRTALEWSFSEQGGPSIANALARNAIPLFQDLSLLSECNRWAEQALAHLRDEDRGTSTEMELQAALALSLMFTKGNSEDVRLAFVKGLALAEQLKDAGYELRLNGGLHMFALRTADFHGALRYAQRCASLAERIGDGVATGIADALLSVSYHLAGDQVSSQRHFEAALNTPALRNRRYAIHFGYDLANRARICLARLLWVQGFPNQAVAVAQTCIREAVELEHPVSLSIALIWTLPVFFWVGDLNAAEESVEWFIQHYERHQLVAYYGVGLGLRGELAIRRGDVDRGINLLRESLTALRINRYSMIITATTSALVKGLSISGRPADALELIDRLIPEVEERGELFYMPDLLRIKGDLQASLPDRAIVAEQTLLQSLDWARKQQALSWELRSATRLAELYRDRGQSRKADSLLRPVYERFTEGFETADLVRARGLLDRLR